MRLCICGIGGTGGRVARNFLENVDLDSSKLSWITEAEYISPGRVTGIWLEADKDDAKNKQHFFKDLNEGGYPGFFIPHDAIPDGCDLHIEVRKKYGYNVKKQGFVRDAQYLKAIFEIFDTDEDIQRIAACNAMVGTAINFESENEPSSKINNVASRQAPNPIFDSAWDSIKPYTIFGIGGCDGILFIVSFGGGTGTGFINPIVDHIRNEGKTDFPVFVLGMLTEPGDDVGQNSKEGQRYLAAISALYDLLTKANGTNGVILIDNQMLVKRFGSNREAQNEFIYKVMKPVVVDRDYPGQNLAGQAMEKEFSRGLSRPPIFVPLYWSQPRRDKPEEELVSKALSEGKLFDCTPEKADKAIVFCRGFIDSKMIRQVLSAQLKLKEENIWVLRKMGEKEDEILILLRNPYGSDTEACTKEGTLENKFCKVIDSALQYMNQNEEDLFYEGKENHEAAKGGEDLPVKLTPLSKQALDRFFFGPDGLSFELKEARKRLEKGEKPFFLYPLRIFQKESRKADWDLKKPEFNGLDEQEIMTLVNKRLAELGLIGSDKDL